MSVLSRLVSAGPDLGLGIAFLVTWISPYTFGQTMVKYAMLTMLLEFIVIHSSGFMGLVLWGRLPSVKKVLAVLGLGAFYSTFLVGFSLAMGQWWAMWAFWGLTFNRMASGLLDRGSDTQVQQRVTTEWGMSAFWYLLWVFATTLLPVPAFGITAGVIATDGIPGEGLWVSEPYRVVVAGAGYFLCQAWVQLMGWTATK